jgi:hypothetical protein
MKKLLSLFAMLGVLTSSIYAEDVSAYLVGEHMDAQSARKALKNVGYEILATYDSVKEGQTIVFTNSNLKTEASKPNRAHAAVLRLFVDNQEKMISITNPVYFGRAFMQDDYNENVFNAELERLNGAFAGLSGSTDKLDDDDLAGYRFMFGMPYYEDVEELAEGDNGDLLSKVKANNENVIFELQVSPQTTLVGYKLTLTPETNAFVEKIGRANAAVLPYCIVIEDGKATALAAKYYLAVSYPSLSMGQFMEIADVPGLIADDLEKAFN